MQRKWKHECDFHLICGARQNDLRYFWLRENRRLIANKLPVQNEKRTVLFCRNRNYTLILMRKKEMKRNNNNNSPTNVYCFRDDPIEVNWVDKFCATVKVIPDVYFDFDFVLFHFSSSHTMIWSNGWTLTYSTTHSFLFVVMTINECTQVHCNIQLDAIKMILSTTFSSKQRALCWMYVFVLNCENESIKINFI